MERPRTRSARSPLRPSFVVSCPGSLGEAGQFTANILATDDWSLGKMEWIGLLFLLPIVGLHVAVWLRERGVVGEPGPGLKAVLAAAMVYGIVTLYAGTADFIYVQF